MRLSPAQGSRAIGVIGLAISFASSAPRDALAQTRAAYPDTQLTKPRVELFGQLCPGDPLSREHGCQAAYDGHRRAELMRDEAKEFITESECLP